jgi:micrococcal nuclease
MAEFPPMPEDRFFRRGVVAGVVDGDTLDLDLDLGWSIWMRERVRLEFVNTPESRGVERAAGLFVKQKVVEWLPLGTHVLIASVAYDRAGRVRGKFGRTLAHVFHAGERWNLNARLLDPAARLAWETDDDGSLIEPRDLAKLTGLPEGLRPQTPPA